MFQISLLTIAAVCMSLGLFGLWAAWKGAGFICMQRQELQRMAAEQYSGEWTRDAWGVQACLLRAQEHLDLARGTGVIFLILGVILVLFAI